MKKRITILPNSHGKKERFIILCSYDYAGGHYFIAERPESKEIVYCQMHWGLFRGTYQNSASVSHDAQEIGKFINEKRHFYPESYPFHGEHYQVTKNKKQGHQNIHISRCGSSKYLTTMKTISDIFKFVVLLIMAGLFGYFYTELSDGITWASKVFPHLSKTLLCVLLYMIEFFGVGILFFVREKKRRFSGLLLNALIPLNVITIIGLAKVNLSLRIAAAGIAGLILFFKLLSLPFYISSKRSDNKKSKKKYRRLSNIAGRLLTLVIILALGVNILGTDIIINALNSVGVRDNTVVDSLLTFINNAHDSIKEIISVHAISDTIKEFCNF